LLGWFAAAARGGGVAETEHDILELMG
jgi:hypothetical protein